MATRSSRTIGLEKNNSANFAKPEVPEQEYGREYDDPGETAQPSSHGKQRAASDPQPFGNLRGKTGG